MNLENLMMLVFSNSYNIQYNTALNYLQRSVLHELCDPFAGFLRELSIEQVRSEQESKIRMRLVSDG